VQKFACGWKVTPIANVSLASKEPGLFAFQEPAMSKNDRVREMLGWKLKNK
jgi:hypothetical protein